MSEHQDGEFQEEELRLHLEPTNENNVEIVLNKEEIHALYTWMEREFIPHNEHYDTIQKLMRKFHDKLAQ